MGTSLSVFPEELLHPDKKHDFIMMLMRLPVPPRRKKEVYVEWCKLTGVVLTKKDVDYLLGREAERGRA